MNKSALELLLHSLDHELSPAEQAQLGEALASSKDLRQERDEYLQMRELLAELRTERNVAFTESVMSRLDAEKESGFWSDIISLSPKVAAACVAFVIISLMGIYFWEGNLSPETIIGTGELTPEDAFTIQEQRQSQKKDPSVAPLELPKQE